MEPWQLRPLRSEPAAWLCLVLASVVVISLVVAIGADLALLTVLNRRVCGEWAPPGWQNDARCDGSLYPLKRHAYATARWSGGGLIVIGGWLFMRRKRLSTLKLPTTGPLAQRLNSTDPTPDRVFPSADRVGGQERPEKPLDD